MCLLKWFIIGCYSYNIWILYIIATDIGINETLTLQRLAVLKIKIL